MIKKRAESQRAYRGKNKMSKCVVEYFEMLHRTFLNFRNGFSTRWSFEKAKHALPKDFNRKIIGYSGSSSSSWYCTSK